jgi:hypothetical protein
MSVSNGSEVVIPSDRDVLVGGGSARSTEEAGQRPRREGAEQSSLPDEGHTAAPEAETTVSTKLAGLVARARKEARLTNVVQYVDEELLRLAFRSLRRQAAPGVDGQSYVDYAANLDQNLGDLHARLKSGRYQAPVIRRVHIPKGNGKLRPLGITTIEDRVVQKAVAWVLSAVFEQDFLDCSHGFRPNRSPHTALHRLREGMMQHWVRYVVEVDVVGFLEPSSHYPHGADGCEEVVHRAWHFDAEPRLTSPVDVDRAQLAALDTLQHGLSGNAQRLHRTPHGQPAWWRLLGEACAEFLGQADLPGRAWSDLLATQEAGLQPAMEGGWGDAQPTRRFSHGHQVAVWRFCRWLMPRDVPRGAHARDDGGRESLSPSTAPPLAVENTGDHCVGVMHGQTTEERHRLLIRAERPIRRTGQRNCQLGDGPAAPAQSELCPCGRAIDVHFDLFEERAQ